VKRIANVAAYIGQKRSDKFGQKFST